MGDASSLAGNRRALWRRASFSVTGRWCLRSRSRNASSASSCNDLMLSRPNSCKACQVSASNSKRLRMGDVTIFARYARFFELATFLLLPESPMLRFKASIKSTTLPPSRGDSGAAMIFWPLTFLSTSSRKAVP